MLYDDEIIDKIIDRIEEEEGYCHSSSSYEDGLASAVDTIKEVRSEYYNKPPTNGDKWREMTDEQIAEQLKFQCKSCPVNYNCPRLTNLPSSNEKRCKEAIVNWLKKEAKEND